MVRALARVACPTLAIALALPAAGFGGVKTEERTQATFGGLQMATLVASYPNLAKALPRMKEEGAKIAGTPLCSTFSVIAIRSAEQVAQAERQDSQVTGVSGFLAKKLMKKASGDPTQPKQELLTTTVEILKIVPDATVADVALPAGYRQK